MLGYPLLFAFQILLAFFGKDIVLARLGGTGTEADRLMEAAVVAGIVWLTALFASVVLASVRRPGFATLGATAIGALIGAAILALLSASGSLSALPLSLNEDFLPIGGAILGYVLRR